jgi:hypothetical protein
VTGKDLLRENQCIGDSFHFRKADIAGSTIVLVQNLVEIVKDSRMPAGSASAIAVHLLQPCHARFKHLRLGIHENPLPTRLHLGGETKAASFPSRSIGSNITYDVPPTMPQPIQNPSIRKPRQTFRRHRRPPRIPAQILQLAPCLPGNAHVDMQAESRRVGATKASFFAFAFSPKYQTLARSYI